jgi:hypothetical protein
VRQFASIRALEGRKLSEIAAGGRVLAQLDAEVHVDVLRYDKDARQWVVTRLFQGKTFEGNAYAYRVACALSELLDS